MAETDQDQKTEAPTEKRLSDARERGEFAKSPELSVLFPLAAIVGVLGLTAHTVSADIAEYAVNIFTRFPAMPVQHDTIVVQLGGMLATTGRALAPALLAIVGGVLLAGGVQSGFQLSPKATAFNFERLNPVAGFQRLFSKSVLVRSGIDLLKLLGIGGALWLGGRALIYDPLFSSTVEVAYLGQFLSHATIIFLTRLLLALGAIAAISYAYEKARTAREQMMTHQEVKEERRQTDGDGQVKAALRRMARRLMRRQMLAAVATADVVITNPTHFAVALRYERTSDRAPVVLAKGENRFAQRIKALAADHGVPVVENPPVARLLFATGRVGESIPADLYQAVAQILAVVYRTHRYYFHRLKARRLEGGA